MNENCDHEWSDGTDPAYWWCHKCKEYRKKEKPIMLANFYVDKKGGIVYSPGPII